VEILVRHLDREGSGMVRFKILLALHAILVRAPELRPDTAPIRRAMERSLERGLQLLHWEAELSRALVKDPMRKTAASALLLEFLRDKGHLTADRLFRLLYLLQPRENFRRIWGGLQAPDLRTRDHSQELLDNLLPSDIGAAVLALVDVDSPAERLASANAELAERRLTYSDLLAEISADKSATLRGFAIYHSTEITAAAVSPDAIQDMSLQDRRVAALDILSHVHRTDLTMPADA
jgi:hypothetical protein